jgi:hypothetical protein
VEFVVSAGALAPAASSLSSMAVPSFVGLPGTNPAAENAGGRFGTAREQVVWSVAATRGRRARRKS